MYFISTGAVEVELEPDPVRLGSGEFFGELALLTDAPRNATVTALCYCNILTLAARDFQDFLDDNLELRDAIYSIAKERTGDDIDRLPTETV
jgi:CPA1 family monovalent cation:H+ antiporter